jgi:hypothetical protein
LHRAAQLQREGDQALLGAVVQVPFYAAAGSVGRGHDPCPRRGQRGLECRLAARPVGLPKPSDWNVVEEPAPEPADGEFRVQVDYLSVDPAMRSWMNAGRSYVPPVAIGEVMRPAGCP